MNPSIDGQRRHRGQQSGNALALWFVLVLVLLPVGATAVMFGRSASERRMAASEELTGLELVGIRSRMAWLHHDLLTDGLMADFDGTELDERRVDLFETQRAAAMAELQDIANGESEWAESALDVFESHSWEDYVTMPYGAWDLEDQHYLSISSPEGPGLAADWPIHDEAVIRTMLPRLVFVDAIAIALVNSEAGPSEWSAEFAEYTFEVVSDTPGWLGPDRNSPLSENVVSSPSAARLDQTPGVHTTAVLSELRSIWDYDAWIVASAEGSFSTQPPLSIDQLALATEASVDALRIDATLALDDQIDRIEAETPSSFTPMAWYILGTGLVLVGILVVGALLYRLIGRHRRLAETAMTDPLTGAKNRRYLDTDVAERCGLIGGHHVMVMVDLDRFKLVNDTWGHDVGDALLRTLTDRLQGVASEMIDSRSDLSAAIVRAGGDEFVVAIHADEPLDIVDIEQRLRSLTGPLDLGQDDAVDLEFSLGIVESPGPVDLSGLLKAADLASYEDKKHRTTVRQLGPAHNEPSVTIEIL